MSPERLSATEERALAVAARAGDHAAAHRLVLSYMPFVIRIARRYHRYGLPLNDLVQEGAIGLIRAVRKYDPSVETRLATYALWWIRAAIQDHVMASWSLVRLGTTTAQRTLFFRLRRLASDFSVSPGWEAAARRIAERFRMETDEVVALARRIAGRDQSLDARAPGQDGPGWIARLVDDRPSPEDELEQRSWRGLIAQAMAKLPPREQVIIGRRYLDEARASLEAVARELDLSRERVRQLEAIALDRLRELLAGAREAVSLDSVSLPVPVTAGPRRRPPG